MPRPLWRVHRPPVPTLTICDSTARAEASEPKSPRTARRAPSTRSARAIAVLSLASGPMAGFELRAPILRTHSQAIERGDSITFNTLRGHPPVDQCVAEIIRQSIGQKRRQPLVGLFRQIREHERFRLWRAAWSAAQARARLRRSSLVFKHIKHADLDPAPPRHFWPHIRTCFNGFILRGASFDGDARLSDGLLIFQHLQGAHGTLGAQRIEPVFPAQSSQHLDQRRDRCAFPALQLFNHIQRHRARSANSRWLMFWRSEGFAGADRAQSPNHLSSNKSSLIALIKSIGK